MFLVLSCESCICCSGNGIPFSPLYIHSWWALHRLAELTALSFQGPVNIFRYLRNQGFRCLGTQSRGLYSYWIQVAMAISTERCCRGSGKRICEFTDCAGGDWGMKEEEEMPKESFRNWEKDSKCEWETQVHIFHCLSLLLAFWKSIGTYMSYREDDWKSKFCCWPKRETFGAQLRMTWLLR